MGNGIKVTPLDIQQKRFHTGFRGYDRTEVEMFLDLVRDEMEALVREVTEHREFRQSYDDRVRELNVREEMVKNTMLMTQKLMEDQKDNARREAAVIIQDAKVQSQQMIGAAQQEKLKLEAEILELKRKKHHFILDLKKVIQMHQEMAAFEEKGDEPGNGAAAG
jgi:cell division initiation protein